jgi:hypothetical protein
MERYTIDNFMGGDSSFVLVSVDELKAISVNEYVVPPKHETRLDLVSYYLYGTVQFQDVLLVVNDITDLEQVQMGLKLYYPSLEGIVAVMNEVSEYK